MIRPSRELFLQMARDHDVVPIARRLMTDQLTPVLAYRRLVSDDQRLDSSFLLESVEVGGQVGRFSLMGTKPAIEVTVHGNKVSTFVGPERTMTVETVANPLGVPRRLVEDWRVATLESEPGEAMPRFLGGWCGHVAQSV